MDSGRRDSAILVVAMGIGAWLIFQHHDSAGVAFALGVVGIVAAVYVLGRHWVAHEQSPKAAGPSSENKPAGPNG